MDGQSALTHAARCAVQGDHLVVSSPDGNEVFARWPLGEVRVDAMHEGGVVHVECEGRGADAALLTLEDPLFVKTLRASGAKIRGLSVGRRGLALGLGCLALFAAVMGGVYAAAPWLSTKIAMKIPLSVEREMAKGPSGVFARKACHTEQADAAVAALLKRLDPQGSMDVDVRVANIAMPNAFAFPGNVVLLTRGLLEGADGPDEIAGVLAHELAHVKHRHALSHMVRNAFLGGLWAATLGDYSGLMLMDPKTAYETATLKYSREAEAEADATGLQMLTAQGISARGLINFLERHSKEESSGTAWLSSHPASEARIAELSRQALREKGPGPPVLDAETFFHLRNACEAKPRLTGLQDLFF